MHPPVFPAPGPAPLTLYRRCTAPLPVAAPPAPDLLHPSHLPGSFMMEYDIHTVLDLLTLLATLGVLYCMLLSKMRVTYQKEQDLTKAYFVVSGMVQCVRMQLHALIQLPYTT